MPADFKKLALFFGGLLLFVVVLVVGMNFALRLVPGATPEDKSPTQKTGSEPEDPRPIIYTIEGFAPPSTTVQLTDAIGCLITVINQSGTPLRVGVNPHSPQGDPGADYGIMPPGESSVLDVRYPGFDVIALHNHSNPAQEFAVKFGNGCR